MGFFDIFFGTPQSLYASYAILAAVITICITILLTGTDLTLGNRFLFIFLVILMLIPSVFLTLFQITCMVTGGNKNSRWWCWLYAWIVAAFIIIYCIFVIIISFSSLFTYSNAVSKVNMQEATNKVSPEVSNEYARKVMVEQFEAEMLLDPPLSPISDTSPPPLPKDKTKTPTVISDTSPPKDQTQQSEPQQTQQSEPQQTKKENKDTFIGTLNFDDVEAFSNDNDNYSAF